MVDPGAGVDVFKPSGEFVQQFPQGGIGIAVDSTNDHLIVFNDGAAIEYSSSGEVLGHLEEGAPGEQLRGGSAFAGMAVDSAGHLYVPNGEVVDIFSPAFILPKVTYQPPTSPARNSVTLNGTVEPNGGEDIVGCHFEYGTDTSYGLGSVACTPDPSSSPPGSHFSAPTPVSADVNGLVTDTTYHYRLVAGNAKVTQRGEDQTYTTPPAVTALTTEPATDLTNVSATLNASFTGEEGVETKYWFEYGTGTGYAHKTPEGSVPGRALGTGTATEGVSTPVAGLVPGTQYHFRIVAQNQYGTAFGQSSPFITYQEPSIEAFSSSGVAATSATLNATLNPHGFTTHYSFEYGTTPDYGQSAPVPAGEISTGLGEPHSLSVDLSGLQRGATYHFRITAENEWGEVTSEDQTFSFFPPSCPNSAVRQQTGSAYLPDCRAYELVSPRNANATLLYSGGPASPYATQPSRFAFTGAYSALPGTETINTGGDLYVATRTTQGWASNYVGLPGDQAGCMGGPPTDSRSREAIGNPAQLQNTVLTDPTMSRFLNWFDGPSVQCTVRPMVFIDTSAGLAPPSNAPFLWDAGGELLRRLPSGAGGNPDLVAALACPYPEVNTPEGNCSGETTASSDLRHLIFSSNRRSFSAGGDPPGLTHAPGSAYSEDLETGATTLISRTAAAGDIPQDPAYAALPALDRGGNDVEVTGQTLQEPGGKEEFIRFPAVSADGSHVLMSTGSVRVPYCSRGDSFVAVCARYLDTPIHLYMRDLVAGVSYEVSRNEAAENVAVNFVGMTSDGGKVYFTSPQRLTSDVVERVCVRFLGCAGPAGMRTCKTLPKVRRGVSRSACVATPAPTATARDSAPRLASRAPPATAEHAGSARRSTRATPTTMKCTPAAGLGEAAIHRCFDADAFCDAARRPRRPASRRVRMRACAGNSQLREQLLRHGLRQRDRAPARCATAAGLHLMPARCPRHSCRSRATRRAGLGPTRGRCVAILMVSRRPGERGPRLASRTGRHARRPGSPSSFAPVVATGTAQPSASRSSRSAPRWISGSPRRAGGRRAKQTPDAFGGGQLTLAFEDAPLPLTRPARSPAKAGSCPS